MIGEVVANRYRIVAAIGAGGGGDVFEAEDLQLPRRVAIKFLSPVWTDERHLRQRFLREAEALSSLDHPHICTIYQTGETESGRMFIAMAYYEGQDLRARLAGGALEISEAISWGISIADGMDKAHRKGFLHRDLKPGNIIITEDGVVKILDFGLAKLPDRTQMTETGAAMGTLAYAAPEQARGEKTNERSDIYSLGVILYQMVTGVCPFAASGAAATLQLVLNSQVAPPRKLRADIPGRLDRLIRECMDRDPQQRPASMEQVRTRLLEVLADLSPSEAAMHRAQHVDITSTPGLPVSHRMRRWLLGLVAVVVAGAIVWQFDAIRKRMTGPPGNAVNAGVVFVPFRTEGDEDHLQRIARGLWSDFNDQAMRLADDTPEFWVLPTDVAVNADAGTAKRRFGVSTIVVGAVSMGGNDYDLDLQALDAASGTAISSISWRIPLEETTAPDLLSWLAGVLGYHLRESRRAELDDGTPGDWDSYRDYLSGLGALQAGDFALAVNDLGQATQADPQFAIARLRYAEAMIGLGSALGDSTWIDRADSLLAAEPRPLRFPGTTYEIMSRVALSRGDRTTAARLLKLALEHRPRNPAIRSSLWYQWWRLRDYEAMRPITLEGAELNPGYYAAVEAHAFVFYSTGAYEEAVTYYSRCLELAPDNANARSSLGACLMQLGRLDEAVEQFEESFAIDPNYLSTSNLGTLYYWRREFDKAADMVELALEYYPDNYVVIGNYASALRWVPERQEEYRAVLGQAASLAEEDLASDPDDPDTISYLASYLTESDPARARRLAERCLALEPANPETLYRVAVTLEELEMRGRALGVLGTAISEGMSTIQVLHEPLLDDLREDSRFPLLLR